MIPDGLTARDAAPLLCAGLTSFTALGQADARPGDLVAVQGIGGVGNLAVQQAKKPGFRVAAIARGTGKSVLAEKLGADVYVDSEAEEPGAALRKLGAGGGDRGHGEQRRVDVTAAARVAAAWTADRRRRAG